MMFVKVDIEFDGGNDIHSFVSVRHSSGRFLGSMFVICMNDIGKVDIKCDGRLAWLLHG